jgi:hypothetical protein
LPEILLEVLSAHRLFRILPQFAVCREARRSGTNPRVGRLTAHRCARTQIRGPPHREKDECGTSATERDRFVRSTHLDLSAIERFEDAPAGYPGALLLVTHDETLARRCTAMKWKIESGRISTSSC